MSQAREVGGPISVSGVPDGLAARSIDTVVSDGDGTVRVRTDRWRRHKLDEIALVADPPTLDVAELTSQYGHRAVRIALAAGSRTVTGTSGRAPELLGLALARAGLVQLRCPVLITNEGLAADRWRRWERTVAGEHAAATYAPQSDRSGPASVATDEADQADGGPAAWRTTYERAYARLCAMQDRAVALTRAGTAAGWPLSRFALEVTGDTHGLTGPVGRLVRSALADAFDVHDPDEPGQVWADAGLGVDVLASDVVAVGLPGSGQGAAARLLAAGADGLPVTLPRVRLLADPDPVAPPPTPNAVVFAVENEALLSWAWRTGVASPVVWSSGTDAAARLLTACGRAGWTVAVSADFEQGGLARASALLSRVPGSVPWRLSAGDYLNAVAAGATSGPELAARRVATPWDPELAIALADRGVRVTEEDRWERLTGDVEAGRLPP